MCVCVCVHQHLHRHNDDTFLVNCITISVQSSVAFVQWVIGIGCTVRWCTRLLTTTADSMHTHNTLHDALADPYKSVFLFLFFSSWQ